MAKLNRERKLLERRAEKQAKKDAPKRARAEGRPELAEPGSGEAQRPPGEFLV